MATATWFKNGACVDLHGEKNAEFLKWFPLNRHPPSTSGSRADRRPTQPFIKVMDLPASFKERRRCDESPSYLLGWLAGYFAADGCVAKDGTVMLNSATTRGPRVRPADRPHASGSARTAITEQRRQGLSTVATPSSLYRIHFINEDLTRRFLPLCTSIGVGSSGTTKALDTARMGREDQWSRPTASRRSSARSSR